MSSELIKRLKLLNDKHKELEEEREKLKLEYTKIISGKLIELGNLLNNDESELSTIIDIMKDIPEDDLLLYFSMFSHYLNQFYKDESYHCKSLLQYVAVYSRKYDPDNKLLKLLVDADANLDLHNDCGSTALMGAAQYSNSISTKETVRMLIRAGANINLQNDYGWTALMYAARYSNISSTEETVRMLIRAGANLNLQNKDGWTALMIAARHSNKDSTNKTVRMLINAGANLDLQNKNGWTALMLAVKYSNTNSTEKTVKMLIAAADTDINLQNKDGDTVFTIVSKHASTELKEYLKKYVIYSKFLPYGTKNVDIIEYIPLFQKYDITVPELKEIRKTFSKLQRRSLLMCCKLYIKRCTLNCSD